MLKRLFRIVSFVDNYKEDYQQVTKLLTKIRRITNILEPSKHKTSASVEKRLAQYIKETERMLNNEESKDFVDNLKRYSKGFWKGLFTCYDHPILPRTNNDLELFFRSIKVKHRRITGLRSWSRYIMRHGEHIVFAENAIKDPNIIDRLNTVTYEEYHMEIQKWKKRTDEHVRRFQFRKNPGQFLKNVEEKWLNQ